MNTLRVKANAGMVILPNGVEVPDSPVTTDVDVDDATLALLAPGVVGDFDGTNLVLVLHIIASSGNWKLTQSPQGATADLAYNISTANLKTAIVGMGYVGTGDLTVGGGPGSLADSTPYTLTFAGDLAATPLAEWSAEYPGQPFTWSEGLRPLVPHDVSLAGTGHGVSTSITTLGSPGALMEDVTAP